MSGDTIFALSSGRPPAAIAVVRISGPAAFDALAALGGTLPSPRRACLRVLRDPASGDVLDRALVLALPGPDNATGEDCAELHLHGGRAVIAAVERALAALPGLRRAEAGEFTRRAFANGRLDLAEAEGLADLLAAETDLQLRNAQALAGGALSRAVDGWLERLLGLSALVEASLDFADEDDVDTLPPDLAGGIRSLADDLAEWLAVPRAETLREGYRVVIAGPPNAGKSSLFNALIDEEAAIATPIAGTTRDVLTRSVAIAGVPFTFTDTAGLRGETTDPVEAIGIERAWDVIASADLVLWLGGEGEGPPEAIEVDAMSDLIRSRKSAGSWLVSALTGEGIADMRAELTRRAAAALPKVGQVAVSKHQGHLLGQGEQALRTAAGEHDALIVAENLRLARIAFDRLTGRAAPEDMLDALFGRFCIGK